MKNKSMTLKLKTVIIQDMGEFPTLYLTLYTNVPVLLILLQEKLIAKDILSWRLGMFLHMTNLFLMLAIPIVVINVKSEYIGVYGATWVTIMYAVLFLKMWSYIQVNHWCRCSITILGHKRVRHQSIYRQASMIRDKNLFKAQSPASLSTAQERDESGSDSGGSRREPVLAKNQSSKPTTWPHNLTVGNITLLQPSHQTLCSRRYLLFLAGPDPLLRAQLPPHLARQDGVPGQAGGRGGGGPQPGHGHCAAVHHPLRGQLPHVIRHHGHQ